MDQSGTIRVAVAASVRLYCEGVELCLAREPGLCPVGSANDESGLAHLLDETGADVVLVDFAMRDAFRLVRTVSMASPRVAVIALAVDEEACDVAACVAAGVGGIVSRDASTADLAAAISAVVRREFPCSPRVARRLVDVLRDVALRTVASPESVAAPAALESESTRLTRREIEVAQLIRAGLSNKQIAGKLSIGIPTVKNHVHSILEKLRVDRREQVGLWRLA